MKMILRAAFAVGLSVASVGSAYAAVGTTIATNTAGTANSTFTPGQSFTVAGSGWYNNIAFNFYNSQGAATAAGKLYLLTSAYTGSVAGLASASGLIGSTTAAGNVYTFAPGVVLTAGTQYYAYSDTQQAILGYGNDLYVGGQLYWSVNGNNFSASAAQDANFLVTGTSAVPEPATWAMMIVGFGLVGGAMRRRSAVTTRVSYAA